jgi:hypothetical protein
MKRLIIVVVALGLLVAIGLVAYHFLTRVYTIEVTEAQLQAALDKSFPVKEQYQLLSLTFSDPRVNLREGEDRIHFGVAVNASVPGLASGSGSGAVSGQVSYDPGSGQFFLREARLEDLQLPQLPEKYKAQVLDIASPALDQVLARTPIYQLGEDQMIARMALRDVYVRGGRLNIVLSLVE